MEAEDFFKFISENYVGGMKKAKKIFSQGSENFDDYSEKMKNSAKFDRCLINDDDTSVYITCKECCYSSVSILCLKCFQPEKHQGHHLSIIMSNTAVCDCGNPLAINESGWCDEHLKHQKIEPLDTNRRNEISNIVKGLLNYAVSIVEKKNFKKVISLVENVSSWGIEYMDIVAETLFQGSYQENIFGRLMESYQTITPQNIEALDHFFNRIVTAQAFKSGFEKFSPNLLERSLKCFTDKNFLKESLKVLSLSSQCFSEAQDLDKYDNYLPKIYESYGTALNFFILDNPKRFKPNFLNDETLGYFYEMPLQVMKNEDFLRKSFINNPKETAEAMIKIISCTNKVPVIKRKTDEKEQYDNDHCLLSYDFQYSFSEYIKILSKKLAQIHKNDITEQDKQKTQNSVYQIFNVFCQICNEKVSKQTTSFGQEIFYIDPLVDEFSFFYPTYDILLFCLARYCSVNNYSPYKLLIDSGVTDDEIFSIVAVICARTGGIFAASSKLFVKNVDGVAFVANLMQCSPHVFLDLFMASQLCEENPGMFIKIMSESFGLKHFLKDENDIEELSLFISTLIRNLIVLALYKNYSELYVSENEYLKNMLICFIEAGCKNRQMLDTMKIRFDVRVNFDDTINEVANVERLISGSVLKLKDSVEVPVFSPYLSYSDFQTYISKNQGSLSTIPEIVDKFFILSDELLMLLQMIVKECENDNRRFTFELLYSLVHLFRIILKFTDNKDKYSCIIKAVIDLSIKNKLGTSLVSQFCIENPEFKVEKEEDQMKLTKPSMKDLVGMMMPDIESSSSEDEKEEDNKQNEVNCAFCTCQIRDLSQSGLLVTCFRTNLLTVCENAISHVELPRFPHFAQMRTCGHICHECCFPKDEDTEELPPELRIFAPKKEINCPLDRSHADCMLPIVKFENIEEDKKRVAKFEASIKAISGDISLRQNVLQNICLYEILLRNDESNICKPTIRKLFSYLIKASFLAEDSPVIFDDVFIQFGCKLFNTDFNSRKENFEKILQEMWQQIVVVYILTNEEDCLMTFVRRAVLLLELIDEDKEIKFPTLDEFIKTYHLNEIDSVKDDSSLVVASQPAPCRKYVFPKLPQNFTEFFIMKNKDLLKALCRSDVSVCRCLACGQFIYTVLPGKSVAVPVKGLESIHSHIVSCMNGSATPILFITGPNASAVDAIDANFPIKYRCESIYVDNFADSDVGLQRGSILHLDDKICDILASQMMSGELRRFVENRDPITVEELIQQQIALQRQAVLL